MSRVDQRQDSEIRPFVISQSLLNNSDGSSSFGTSGHTAVCGINGPVEVKYKDEVLGEAYIEVNFKPVTGNPSPNSKFVSKAIKTTIEHSLLKKLHPRTMIQVNLQPLAINGEITSLCINATSLALVDSGLPLSTIIGAAACVINQDDDLLLDPTTEEIESAKSIHVFAFSSKSGDEVIFSDSLGNYSIEQYFECFKLCQQACNQTVGFINQAVEKKLEIDLKPSE